MPMNVLGIALLIGTIVPSLPPCEFADTEVSTNIPVAVSLESTSRLEFSLSLDASPTNAVEVSVGTDANDDGCLSLDETDYAVGYRCGKWFQRDAAGNSETETDAPQEGRLERTFILRKRKLDPVWNLVKVVRRGAGEVCELTKVEGKKPGFALEVR